MEAMRNRLLAQQLGLSSPADKGGNDARASPGPSTPGGRSARPEARVRMMPSTPGTPGGPSTPGSPATPMSSRKMLWNSPTPSRSLPGSPRRTPLGAGRPPSTPNQRSGLGTPTPGSPSDRVTAAERDRQLQAMLTGMVHVHGDVDMAKARVAGLECLLLPHQVQGVEWMKQREHGEHKAGILADDMGLGKTVQMLALMQQHRNADAWRTSRGAARAPEQSKHATAPATPTGGRVAASEKAEQRARASMSPSPLEHSPTADLLRNKNPERATPLTKTEQATDRLRTESSSAVEQTAPHLPTLIVAPLAVVQQWENEAREKTGGRLKVYVHHGPQRSRSAAILQQADLVVTTYATASSEHEALLRAMRQAPQIDSDNDDDPEVITVSDSSDNSESDSDAPLRSQTSIRQSLRSAGKAAASAQAPSYPLFQVDWLRVVLDEAQNIKNHRAKTSQACFALGRRALARWCLTGTPLQNNALELYSLIHFLGVPPFNDLAHYKEKIDEPLKSTSQTRVNWGIKRLSVVLQSIMLRRTKDTSVGGRRVLELPERKVEVVSSDFRSPEERAFYRALEERIRSNLQQSEQAGDAPMSFMGVLVMLLRLRQACNHPALVLGRPQRAEPTPAALEDPDQSMSKAPGDEDELADMLATLSVNGRSCERCQAALPLQESEGPVLCPACERAMEEERQRGVDWTTPGRLSTKLQTVLELLEQFRASARDDKTLLFSQFTSFLDLLEPALNSRGWTFVRYDGSMRRDARETALRRIRTDETVRVILVSFRAGSTGLNLTCCNRVILTDLWWNPQIEEQAFDRAHRLGQTKPVYIYKLSIKDTVEQRILDLQEKKRALAKAALEGTKLTKRSNRLTQAELSFLFHGGEYADVVGADSMPV